MTDRPPENNAEPRPGLLTRQKRQLSSTGKCEGRVHKTSPKTSPQSKRRRILDYLRNGFRAVSPSRAAALSHPESADKPNRQQDRHKEERVQASSSSLEKAATVIQRAWRYKRLYAAVMEWSEVNVTVKRLADMSFEDATRLMQSAAIVQGSSRLLTALFTSTPDSNEPTPDIEYRSPGRAFVAGHLFAAHPRLLVTGNSHIDTMIESSAVIMAETYGQFEASFLKHEVSWFQRQQTFVAGFKAFYSALDSWKRSDTKKLLSTMERHYLELDRLWQSVQRRTLGEGDENWRVGIQLQREQLIEKIRTLGGDEAVDELMQRQKELRLTYNDPQPSPTPSLVPPSQGDYSPIVNAQFVSSDLDKHKPASTSLSSPPLPPEAAAATSIEDSDTIEPSVVLTKAIADQGTHTVDKILSSFDLSASAALQDVKLAHDLVLDPEMRLEPAAGNTLVGAVQQAVTRAFFDHIRQDIESGNSDYIVRTLAQLRLDMRTIIPPESEMHTVLEREFDQDWMSTQLLNGALDIKEKYRLVLQAIRAVCAPIRDSEVDSISKELDAISDEALTEVGMSVSKDKDSVLSDSARQCVDQLLQITRRSMELIRNVRMDVLNYQLSTVVRPWLRVHAVEYERAAVLKELKSTFGSDRKVAQHINAWLEPALVREQNGACTLQHNMHTQNSISPKHIFFESFLDLCFAATSLASKDTPPALKMDQQRIQYIQNELQTILCAAALSTLTKRFTPASDSQMHRNAHLFLDILRADNVDMDRIVRGVQEIIPKDEAHLVERLVVKTLSKDDTVYRVMERKLREFLLIQIERDEMPGDLGRRLGVSDGRREVSAMLSKMSLQMVQREICALLVRISQLCTFNWQVYSVWYSQLC
ncbi:hypothetical protein LPJ53_005404 [Coemansia erecta]|uniref:Tcp11-domain-containing protein n=1 Tax=Coemansia erecta TaxID=147472 RepID=A0A9W7XV42_9FUNG|nr:hypothetical protein LPJ53_005404 [Coemansia erecta]